MLQLLAIKAIQFALCHFLGFCMNQEDCPDGVCDEAAAAVDSLGDDTPQVSVSPVVTQAFLSDFNWSAMSEVATAIVALVEALKKLMGNSRVG